MAAIRSMSVNHFERNYFGGEELREDTEYDPSPILVCKTVDKLVRRAKRSGQFDCMFTLGEDGTGYRLSAERGRGLVLRHYVDMGRDSWDGEWVVSAAKVKSVLRKEYWGC